LEDFFDAAPVGYLDGGNGESDGDGVEAEEAMTEYDGVLG